jgi:hypothetical protein
LLNKIKKKHINVEINKNLTSTFVFNLKKKIMITKINIKEFIFLFKGVKKFNDKAINDAVITPIKAL